MSAVDELAIVRDAEGRVHERNPLGLHACLECAQPFPCPSSMVGEQLLLEVDRG